jgi:hypothetical protein
MSSTIDGELDLNLSRLVVNLWTPKMLLALAALDRAGIRKRRDISQAWQIAFRSCPTFVEQRAVMAAFGFLHRMGGGEFDFCDIENREFISGFPAAVAPPCAMCMVALAIYRAATNRFHDVLCVTWPTKAELMNLRSTHEQMQVLYKLQFLASAGKRIK